jgi:hypothetical protein
LLSYRIKIKNYHAKIVKKKKNNVGNGPPLLLLSLLPLLVRCELCAVRNEKKWMLCQLLAVVVAFIVILLVRCSFLPPCPLRLLVALAWCLFNCIRC